MSKNVGDTPGKYYLKIEGKLGIVNKRLAKKSTKYLDKLARNEKRLQRKLSLIDARASADLFSDTQKKYSEFLSTIKSQKEKMNKPGSGQYDAYMDTLGTSLNFLKQFKGISDKVKTPLKSLTKLQGNFQQSEKIKEYITERKEQIKQVLSRYTKLPQGLQKDFSRLNKTAYYYASQVKEYKEILKDPVKGERKALSLLNKLPAFQKFMQKNSQLASMFRMPDNSAEQPDLAGLQTRASIQGLLQQQIAGGGPNAQQVIQQNIAQAKNELEQVKSKIIKNGGGSSDTEMPDFKPNAQKTKSFFKRLQYGANIQSEKTNALLPVTSDLALTAGYKLDDKNVVGLGASYKIGWGTGWKHIKLSNEGIGLRSFIDMRLKGSFWISGGYEKNYQQAFAGISELNNFSAWQTSGLLGMTKKYKIGKRTKSLQLLWDFLSYQQIPRRQPVLFRIGSIF